MVATNSHVPSTNAGPKRRDPPVQRRVRLEWQGEGPAAGYSTLAVEGAKESAGSVGHPDGCASVDRGSLGWVAWGGRLGGGADGAASICLRTCFFLFFLAGFKGNRFHYWTYLYFFSGGLSTWMAEGPGRWHPESGELAGWTCRAVGWCGLFLAAKLQPGWGDFS